MNVRFAKCILSVSALLMLIVPPASAQQATGDVPVLVELFTSEGCSSCPPADALVRDLVEEQPFPGIRVVALGLHVDYWDRLGWKDRFADPGHTERQRAYAAISERGVLYTPQMVVDGRWMFVGSDRAAARRSIVEAAGEEKILLGLDVEERDGLEVRVRASGIPDEMPRRITLFAAFVQDEALTRVKAGENGGRVLRHASVVRDLESLGQVDIETLAREGLRFRIDPEGWQESMSSRIVLFLQDPRTLRIRGVGYALLR